MSWEERVLLSLIYGVLKGKEGLSELFNAIELIRGKGLNKIPGFLLPNSMCFPLVCFSYFKCVCVCVCVFISKLSLPKL